MDLAPGDRYRAVEVQALPAGDDQVLAWRAGADRAALVPGHQVELLRRCARFATLTEHAVDTAAALGLSGDAVPALCEELEELRAQGWLFAEGAVRERIAAAAPDPGLSIDAVCLLTRDRPATLLRAVHSYADNCVRHGRRPVIVIGDDTADPPALAQTRQGLRALEQRTGLRVRHLDLAARGRLADELAAASGVEPRLARFALLGGEGAWTLRFGANRNTLLLATAGHAIASADDDSVCRLAASPAPAPGAALSTASDPSDVWFFRTRDLAQAAAPALDEDWLALHERFLGRTVAACLSGDAVELEGGGDALLGALLEGNAQVSLTFTGAVGDSGVGFGTSLLECSPSTRARLLASEEEYATSWSSREVVRVAARPTISEAESCIGISFGLDNRALVAPFPPVLAGEDGVFAALSRRSFPHRFHAFLPRAVLHAPPLSRVVRDDLVAGEPFVTPGEIVALAVDSVCLPRRAPAGAARLELAGQSLLALAALTPGDFRDWVRERWWASVCGQIAALEHLGTLPAAHPRWARDVAHRIETSRAALLGEEILDLDEPGVRVEPAEAWARTQSLVRDVGDLLLRWPALWAAACARDRT